MKIARALGSALIVIVLALVAVGVYLAATFDYARVKREAEAAVKAKTGRTFVIAGDIGLSFWPSVGVKIEKATLFERNGKESFASVESAHVAVQVWPLLSKQIIVDRISLDGLLVILKRDSAGRLNIDDLLRHEDAPRDAEAGGPASATKVRRLDIAGVDVGNARLEWHDRQSRRDIVLTPLDIETGRLSIDADGMWLRDVKLNTRAKLDSAGIDVKLELPSFDRHGDQIDVPRADLGLKLSSARRNAEASIALSGIAGATTQPNVKAAAFAAQAEFGDKTLKAKLQSAAHFDLDAGSIELPRLAGTLDIDMPGLPKRSMQLPIDARLLVHYREPDLNGRVKTAFDDTQAEAIFDIGPFSPLTFALDLNVDKLDIDRYLSAKSVKAAKPAFDTAKAGNEPEAPIDLSPLKAFNAKGSVRIGALHAKGAQLRNVRASFKCADGRLALGPHSADLYGGRLSGNAAIDSDGNVVALKESLSNIDIAPLTKDIADKNPLEGRGDVSLDIRTQGATAAAMKKSLAGSAKLKLRDGAIKGINLARTLRDAKARLHGEDVTQEANAVDRTDFSELAASFRIADGVAHNDDLAAKSPFLRLGGHGDIDIGEAQLDYLLLASVVGTSAGQGGKELDALKGITVPVRVTGSFEKPAFKLDMANLLNDAAKARIEEKRDEAKHKLQENIRNRLKDLFDK